MDYKFTVDVDIDYGSTHSTTTWRYVTFNHAFNCLVNNVNSLKGATSEWSVALYDLGLGERKVSIDSSYYE